jgi:hypothetical protein
MRLLPININRVILILILLGSVTSVSGDTPRKFDEIPAYFPWSDVMARLDNVAITFRRESPDLVLYLIAYAGRQGCVGDADRLNSRAKNYLVAKRGVDSRRIILMDGGYLNRPMIDVWMVPSYVSPPQAVPNIDQKLVRVRNCRKRSSAQR